MTFAFIFNLWASTVAVAAAAVSVPIIIHLLNRRRFKIVDWAAMRFLLAAQKQTTKKMRLEQIILLCLRCLLLFLIVLAMASVMPWAEDIWAAIWPEGAFTKKRPSGRTHHILVIDGSLSMNQAIPKGPTAFKRALEQAIDTVEHGGGQGDGFSVLLLKDNPTWVVGNASQTTSRVADEIRNLRPSHGNASLASALTMVHSKILDNTRRFSTQVVYFYSDMQHATWQGAMDVAEDEARTKGVDVLNIFAEIQKEAQFALIDVGKDKNDNCAVVDLYIAEPLITSGQNLELVATVQNFSETKKTIDLELLVGMAKETGDQASLSMERVRPAKLDDVEPRDRKVARFTHTLAKPGTYVLQVRARASGDKLEADNTRSLVVTIKKTVPILIVCGVPADVSRKKYLDKTTEFLREALNPAPGEEDGWTRLMPTAISQDDFGRMKREELIDYDALFLVDIAAPAREEVEFIQEFLRRGRGVVMSLGDMSARDIKNINEALYKEEEGLLPLQLVKRVTAPENHFFTLNAEEEAFHFPPLKAFADGKHRLGIWSRPFETYVQTRLASPRVREVLTYMPEVAPGHEKEKWTTDLRVGDPALVEWKPLMPRKTAGKRLSLEYPGKFVVFTSTFNKKLASERTLGDGWNFWAGSPSYVALVQELVRLVMPPRLLGHAYTVSEALEDIFPSSGKRVEATVDFPEEAKEQESLKLRTLILPPLDDVLDFRFGETDFSGIYTVKLEGDPREIPYAVNFPSITADKKGSECNLVRVDKKQLQDMYPQFIFTLHTDWGQVEIQPGPHAGEMIEERVQQGPHIAYWVLLAVLVLLFVETILAWQFGHYSKVEGATPAAPMTLAWPLTIAGVAIALFAAGAFVLIHTKMTGDFLSFLPDRFRIWTETKVFGLEPPPPGETSRWTLETYPWLPRFLKNNWFELFLAVGALLLIFFVYRKEGPGVSPWFKGLLGGLRFFLVMVLIFNFLPQNTLSIDRLGMPEIVVLIDDSLSMGVPDNFKGAELEAAKKLYEPIRTRLREHLKVRVNQLKLELEVEAAKDPKSKETEELRFRVDYLANHHKQLDEVGWRPSRLSLAQAVMLNPDNDWLRYLVKNQRSKVHVYHLDIHGKATKLTLLTDKRDKNGKFIRELVGDLSDPADQLALDKAKQAVAGLDPEGKDSQLGLSLREVINQYRGSALTAVIMVTDGVTTREETIKEVADHAKRASVPLIFLGIGETHDIQNLELDGLQVDDTIYLGDRALFQARVIGKGFKDLEVPIVLKVREKDGHEKEVDRVKRRIDPDGKPVKFTLAHQPTEAGKKRYIIEVEVPKADKGKGAGTSKLRLERDIEVIETKQIKVLYVEGQPRYEFRYLKALLERESPDDKKHKSIDLKILLLDADPEFHNTDRTALRDFPATREDLEGYDVIIMGDCDPRHPKLGDARLKMIAEYVRGDEVKGSKRKSSKVGAGLLLLSGPFHNPHAYRDTPLGPLLPIEPTAAKPPPEPESRTEKLRLEWTTLGRLHNLFKLQPDDGENALIWKRLAPMYWYSSGYKVRERAEVLAVHPTAPGEGGAEKKHALIAQQLVGAGRSVFFGFEEAWRWRFREDETQYKKFWINAVRYMARIRQNRTELRLDRQTPYRDGDTIKVTVTFPESMSGYSGPKAEPENDVVVAVEYYPVTKEDEPPPKPEGHRITLAKVGGSLGTYEASFHKARAGKYHFWLFAPDVHTMQADNKQPSADALVILPPQELEDLRLNAADLKDAAHMTRGKMYTLKDVDKLLEELPEPERPNLGSPQGKQYIWNHWLCFALALLLFSGEWILRKKKHLL